MTYAERYPSESWASELEKEIRGYLQTVLPGAIVRVYPADYYFRVVFHYNDEMFSTDVGVSELRDASWFQGATDSILASKIRDLVRFTVNMAYKVS